jgi:hypothetical protein
LLWAKGIFGIKWNYIKFGPLSESLCTPKAEKTQQQKGAENVAKY